jgi:predicted PurR-regulated permease PerM
VTIGVLGIAFIQAVAGGAGMMLAGVPAAGVWALLILIVAIAQLPPLVVLLPVILYVFSHNDSTLVAVIFAIWSVLVSFADAALKPMLLGRGVDAPMPVILLGAIGGMLYSGIIGLFLGAVILALGYRMFMVWLTSGETPAGEPERETGTG